MEDRARNRGRWTVIVIVVAAVVLLPLFYVLSSGPALWLAEHGWVDKSRLPTVYWPIGWAIVRSDGFRRIMWRYLELWDETMKIRSVDPFQPPMRVDHSGN
jgi:hypothetical protein